MELESLRALYVDELKDLYSAEGQILKALPRMIKAASHKRSLTSPTVPISPKRSPGSARTSNTSARLWTKKKR